MKKDITLFGEPFNIKPSLKFKELRTLADLWDDNGVCKNESELLALILTDRDKNAITASDIDNKEGSDGDFGKILELIDELKKKYKKTLSKYPKYGTVLTELLNGLGSSISD